MERLFWFSLLLNYLTVTDSTDKAENCLSQPSDVIYHKTGQSAVLSCTINPWCSADDWEYEWFSFQENFYFRLTPLENHHKYTLHGANLHIHSLVTNDSGIYHCAAASRGEPARGKQHVGLGTTLVVRDNAVVNILLWLIFVLLLIYSLSLVTLILKRHGFKRIHRIDKYNLTKKGQFRDVLQEMYKRRNMERSKPTVSRNRSQPERAAGTDTNVSTDDIYQNV